MKDFFEVIEEHANAAICISCFIYLLVDLITSNLKKK